MRGAQINEIKKVIKMSCKSLFFSLIKKKIDASLLIIIKKKERETFITNIRNRILITRDAMTIKRL